MFERYFQECLISPTLLHLLAEFLFFLHLLMAPSSHSLFFRDFAFVFLRSFSSISSPRHFWCLIVSPLIFALDLVAFQRRYHGFPTGFSLIWELFT